MTTFESFEAFFRTATGNAQRGEPGKDPYPYQSRLAREGLPSALEIPTGAGKTAATILAWLWRACYADAATRATTPRHLLYILPTRTLIEQTEAQVQAWLSELHLVADVELHVLMGGRLTRKAQNDWRRDMHKLSIVLATADCAVSRLLMRGYGAARGAYPIDFALLHNGTHIIVDEVQLVQQATATCRQLEAFQRQFGTAAPSALTCMSATVERRALNVVDNRWSDHDQPFTLSAEDLTDPQLQSRLDAAKSVRHLSSIPTAKDLAAAVLERHKAGSLSLVILNTVDSAKAVYEEIGALSDQPRLLLHSRFRPVERRKQADRLQKLTRDGGDLIIVSTQVIEAGVDLDATTLFTEAAPWPSLCQRAGRLNRAGKLKDALLYWFEPLAGRGPYEPADVEAAMKQLRSLLSHRYKAQDLLKMPVPSAARPLRFLRRADLLALFDTAPDLAGNDIDVSPYIRETDERLDLYAAWVDPKSIDARHGPTGTVPPEDHRCPVVPRDIDALLTRLAKAGGDSIWHYSPSNDGWIPLRTTKALRPNDLLVVSRDAGGYRTDVGFSAGSPSTVLDVIESVEEGSEDSNNDKGQRGADAIEQQETDHDAASLNQPAWESLEDHLAETRTQAESLVTHLGTTPDSAIASAVVTSAALHDLGKAHPDWQQALVSVDKANPPPKVGVWAKSPKPAAGMPRTRLKVLRGGDPKDPRRSFRHELVSLLMLRGPGATKLLEACGVPQHAHDLARYLVAAHHGVLRMQPRDPVTDGRNGRSVLGLTQGEKLPKLPWQGVTLGGEAVDLRSFDGGDESWTRVCEDLLAEHGPFVLAYLEALVRVADWRASEHLEPVGEPR